MKFIVDLVVKWCAERIVDLVLSRAVPLLKKFLNVATVLLLQAAVQRIEKRFPKLARYRSESKSLTLLGREILSMSSDREMLGTIVCASLLYYFLFFALAVGTIVGLNHISYALIGEPKTVQNAICLLLYLVIGMGVAVVSALTTLAFRGESVVGYVAGSVFLAVALQQPHNVWGLIFSSIMFAAAALGGASAEFLYEKFPANVKSKIERVTSLQRLNNEL